MLRYLANEQYGSWIVGVMSLFSTVIMRDSSEGYRLGVVLLTMLAIAIVSGIARERLKQFGGVDVANSRLNETLSNDRALLGRGKQQPASQQAVEKWQRDHAIVFIGACSPKIVRGKVQYANELTLMRARLSDVLDWAREHDFKFFSYNQALDPSELLLWKDNKKRPESSALYMKPTTAEILIIGSTAEEVFNFKPHEDLLPDWKKMYAFGQWRLEHDHDGKVVIHDEVTEIQETEKDAPLADASVVYDPRVRGRGAFKKGYTLEDSVVSNDRHNGNSRQTQQHARVEYVK